jgi:hypothetical protein
MGMYSSQAELDQLVQVNQKRRRQEEEERRRRE